MQWTRVLVFADPTPEGVARLQMARQVCSDTPQAVLEVCVARLAPERPYGYGAGVLLDDYEAALAVAETEAQRAVGSLRKILNGQADRVEFSTAQADPPILAQMAAARGRTSDLIVLGQPASRRSRLERALLKGALIGSGRPCLVLPQWVQPRGLSGRAFIAWKGTPEAARAVRDALPLLRRMETTRIFEAAEADELRGEGPEGLNRLAGYLSAHGVKVEPPVAAAPPDGIASTVGQAILDEAMAFGAELLVMGGFGHARLIEVVFGGATQAVLENARCAVLISH